MISIYKTVHKRTKIFGYALIIAQALSEVNLTDIEQKFVFSLELVWEDNRWQVTREVAVMQPEN